MKRHESGFLHAVRRPVDMTGPVFAGLLDALLAMRTPSELRALLEDLCTPAELEAIADRWRVVPLLLDNHPYREIHDLTGVSVTTIGRISRCLGLGAGGYRMAAERVLSDRTRNDAIAAKSSGSDNQ